jgi:transcriptional regulator with XRE-family HTH domain
MNRLRYERVNLGLSQDALGVAVRVAQSDIAKAERGEYFPGPAILDRLSRVLGVPAEYLLREVEIIKPEAAEPPPPPRARRDRTSGETPVQRLERARQLVVAREAELATILSRAAKRANAAKTEGK